MSHFEGLLVHLFALSTPVLFYPWMTDVTRIKTLVGLLICGSLLSVHVLRRNCDSRPIRGFRLIFTLYCSWTFLSCLWSVSPIASTAEIIRLCSSLALMLVIPSLSLLRKPAIHPARSLALITAVVSAYAVLQSANLDPLVWSKPTGDGVVSTLGHPNALGAFLIIGIAAQMIEIAGRVDRISRYFYGFPLIFLSFIAMGLSMSKGAWMGVACGLFVYWLLGARTPARTRVSFLAGLIIIAGITAALLPGSFLSDLVQTNQFRIQTYRQSLRIYTDDFSPLEKLVGTGAGTYSHAFDRFRDPSYLVRFKHAANLEHAHSEPIEILLETGIIGLGLFSCFICFVIRFAWRNRSEFSVRVWTSASMGLVFHNLVCVNMRWFVPWTFWILAIAFIGSSTPQQKTSTRTQNRTLQLIGLLLLPIWVYGAIRTSRHIQADLIYYQAKTTFPSGRFKDGAALLDRATGYYADDLAMQYDRAFAHAQAGHTRKSIELYDSILRVQRMSPK